MEPWEPTVVLRWLFRDLADASGYILRSATRRRPAGYRGRGRALWAARAQHQALNLVSLSGAAGLLTVIPDDTGYPDRTAINERCRRMGGTNYSPEGPWGY